MCERRESRDSVHYEAESPAKEQDRAAIVEELLAAGVPPDLLDETADWTVTFYASYYNRPLILAALIKAAGPNAAALVTTHRGQRCATSPVSTLDWQMQVCTSLK